MSKTKIPEWIRRLSGARGKEATAGASKHSRGKQKPRYWRLRKKRKRKIVKAARKRNR